MDAIEAIMTRRSIRQYTSQVVDRPTVDALLKAAMAAPTAGNQQSWRFIVIEDRELLDTIPTIHPYTQMLPQASVAILVCAVTDALKHPGYWVDDAAAATMSLLLAAQAMGLGAVWCGVHGRADRVSAFKEMFGLPDGVEPVSLVPLGYPAESKPPADRYDETKVHRDRW